MTILYPEGKRPHTMLPARDQLEPGSSVQFGAFPQTKDGEFLPLVWNVIETWDEGVLLLSEMEIRYLDAFRFGVKQNGKPETEWKASRVRRILNEGFAPCAFTEEERRRIIPWNGDFVFLLNGQEVEDIVPKRLRQSGLTEFARKQCPGGTEPANNAWLTRPGVELGMQALCASTGVLMRAKGTTNGGFRPALELRLPEG